MAMQEIPLPRGGKNYNFTIDLNGDEYDLDIKWNVRASAFYMDVYDSDGTAIILGKRMEPEVFLLDTVQGTDRPFGELVLVDDGRVRASPTPETISEQHKLVFIDPVSLVEDVVLT